MPTNSIFQYRTSGGVWTTELNKIRFTITDTLGLPMEAVITVANFDNADLNARESVYFNYQQVRITEGDTSEYIFYGKVEDIDIEWDESYGQIITIKARDNLNEGTRRTINTDVTGITLASTLIIALINGNANFAANFFSGNVATSDFGTASSDRVRTSTQSNSGLNPMNYTGMGDSVLKAILDLSIEDLNSSSVFGHDYYLDLAFSNANTPVPHFHYFVRGTRPNGGASSSGLTVQYRGTASNQLSQMLGDYNFPRKPKELVTRVRIEFVDGVGISQSLEVVLLNHGAESGGTGVFQVAEVITWPTTGSANVEYVDSTNNFLLVSRNILLAEPSRTNLWLETISGQVITGGTTATQATVAASSASPPGSLREHLVQDIEIVLRDYYIVNSVEAVQRAAGILKHGGDTITRGNFKIIGWPFYTITGTHTTTENNAALIDLNRVFTDFGIFEGAVVTNTTKSASTIVTAISTTGGGSADNTLTGTLSGGADWDIGNAYRIYIMVRAGHLIRVNTNHADIASAARLNEDMLVTKIEYDEGPGIHTAQIEVLRYTVAGAGAYVPTIRKILYDMNKATSQSAGAIGAPGALMTMFVGTYAGNDATPRNITGVGFTPIYVRITSRGLATGSDIMFEATTNSLDAYITTFGADGFTITTAGPDDHPNNTGTTYDFIAFGVA